MSDLSSQVSFNLHCNFISLKQQAKSKFLNSYTVLSVDLIMQEFKGKCNGDFVFICLLQFFLQADDIGKNRAEVSLKRISELNSYVRMSVSTEQLTEKFLGQFQVSIAAQCYPQILELNTVAICFHTHSMQFSFLHHHHRIPPSLRGRYKKGRGWGQRKKG